MYISSCSCSEMGYLDFSSRKQKETDIMAITNKNQSKLKNVSIERDN